MGQPEVHELDAAVGRQLDVCRLDVAVDDRRLLAVQVAEHITELVDPREDDLQRQKAALAPGLRDPLAQVWSGHVVHDQAIVGVQAEVVGDLRQIGVVKPAQGARFDQKLSAHGLGG